ncbi:MAG: hypothetical protein C3F06_08305 [Candidatus Methanoperedenaceae archaeon]|nr:MAG: hypothetical protein C3F06_08305 [Candidatus Methanoperedenaceae archaeon]
MQQTILKNVDYGIDIKELQKLPPDKRTIYDRSIVLKLIQKNSTGITVPQITKMAGLSHQTVKKHADFLVAIREVYKQNMGIVDIYYPNGRIEHPLSQDTLQIGNKFYSFYYLNNPLGDFIHIQEKQKDEFNTFTATGGLVIEKRAIYEFLEQLRMFIEHNQEKEKTKEDLND